jgi:hypothetical protein
VLSYPVHSVDLFLVRSKVFLVRVSGVDILARLPSSTVGGGGGGGIHEAPATSFRAVPVSCGKSPIDVYLSWPVCAEESPLPSAAEEGGERTVGIKSGTVSSGAFHIMRSGLSCQPQSEGWEIRSLLILPGSVGPKIQDFLFPGDLSMGKVSLNLSGCTFHASGRPLCWKSGVLDFVTHNVR